MGASFPNLVSQMCDPGVHHLTKFVSQICDRGVRHDPILVSQNNDLVSVMVRHLAMEKNMCRVNRVSHSLGVSQTQSWYVIWLWKK